MDDPLNTDNLLNEEEEPNINLNINNPDLEYVTDSDITVPKYMPTGNIPQIEENMIENLNNYENVNLGVPNQNEIMLQNEIANLENKSMIANKTLQQLEDENDQLKEELMRKKAKIKPNEGINNEFRYLVAAFL